MTDIQKLSSGAKWESIVGYSRAVKIGDRIIIGGTTAIDENSNVIGREDAYAQTKYIFKKIEIYLEHFGASLENVIHNKIYVTDISRWEEIAKAHAEIFSKIKPLCTMIEIKGLVSPDMLVEIETEAVIS